MKTRTMTWLTPCIASVLLCSCGGQQQQQQQMGKSSGPPMQGLLDAGPGQQQMQPGQGQAPSQGQPPPLRPGEERGPDGQVATASGLQYKDIIIGNGPSPVPGQTAVVHYTGWLQSNGKKFDSSLDRGQPFRFVLGQGQVIKGWDEGVASMRVGGKRRLFVPPELGYGATGAAGVIPPNAVLIFDVQLLGVDGQGGQQQSQQNPGYRTE